MPENLEALARKYALQNALEHDGKAEAGAVIGRIMAADPGQRSNSKDVAEIARATVSEVNAISIEDQKAELEALAPELLHKEKKEMVHELPDLENVGKEVVMRLAPNPSGPLHLGHTRMAILNDEYVKRYRGKLFVRMEDTNPPTILPEAYDLILEDLDWLGVKYHEVVNQSSRFPLYYKHAEELLTLGHAYMCNCEPDDWRKLKEAKRPCPHRDLGPDQHVELWKRMLAGDFSPGEMSLIVKTDLEHPNPAVRDFVALRLVDEPHPLTGHDHRVYPLYNFSVAVDDHLMGMTHVLRGKDHLNNTLRQEYVYEHLGWPKPEFIHYGWVSIEDTELSTRQIRAAIGEGKYTGWDDVRLGTVAALARRGIQPDAIRKYWIDVGIKSVDIKFSWQNLYAYNKDIIDPTARRYSFVWNPKAFKISGVDRLSSDAPLHPERPELGSRHVVLSGDDISVSLPGEETEGLATGNLLRLKDLCNVEVMGDSNLKYIGNDLSILKQGAKIINWVGPDAVPTNVHMPDGDTRQGLAEKAVQDALGEVVQFERFGFVRIELGEKVTGFFAHK